MDPQYYPPLNGTLARMAKSPYEYHYLRDYLEDLVEPGQRVHIFVDFLEDNSLVVRHNDNHKLSEKGRHVALELRSVEAYLQKQEEEKAKQQKIEQSRAQKELWDTQLAKWQVKTFWYVFAAGILGFGLSLYNFIKDLVE